MSKINIKLNKEFSMNLTGSIGKSSFEGNKKLLSLFDLINTHKKDNTIDVKEITDFASSIFRADTNNDGEVDSKELEAYVNADNDKYKNQKIKAKDIMEFLKTFAEKSDKTDEKNQRITNEDGSYSIIYEEVEQFENFGKQQTKVTAIKINYDKDNQITTTETTNGNTRTIKDKDGNVLTTQQLKDNNVVSEKKADGLNYYYSENKTTIKTESGNIVKEIEILESGKKIIKEFKEVGCCDNKTLVTTTNEETGEISKETIYKDGYYISVTEYGVISLRSIKAIINNPISSDTLHSFNYMGKDAILTIAKEDDINFQKTYITGMVDKIIEIAELIGEDSNEVKSIQKEIKEKGFENLSIDTINQAYSKLFEKIQKAKPEISASKINNRYYKSELSYTKAFTNNKIFITDDKNNKTVIDKNKLLAVYSSGDKEVMWDVIKDLPAEALVDMVTEVTFMNIREDEGSAGSFNYAIDKINISSADADVILHEMGHAIDCKGKGSKNNYQTMHNAKLKQAFAEEMTAFEKAGNKRCKAYYDSKGVYQTKNDTLASSNSDNNSTYATVNEQEMFAECYALLMNGTCQSEEVIQIYFPKTLACVSEMVENTRKLPKAQRHN